MKKQYYILLFLLLCSTTLFAQGKFTATVSQNEVAVGEQFIVEYTIEGNASDFNPPDFAGFQVVSGPNLAQNMVSVNGTTTYSTSYSYILIPTKEGSYTVGAATINFNFRQIHSNSVKIKVTKAVAAAQGTTQQADAAADNAPIDTKNLSKQLFIRADVDKSQAYQGEQIKVSYKLYTRVALLASQVDKAPDLNGFWSQDIINKNPNATWTEENYKGTKYHVATIKQTVLFPEHSGDITIDPIAFTFMVRLPVKGMLDNPFGNYQDVKYQVKSAPVIIHAIPLPAAGKPANFTGAVGNFTVKSDVDKTDLKANESLNYTFEIMGSGNLTLINAPNINPPADFEKYDPKTTDHINVDENGVSGSRQYSYLLIPRHQGSYDLSPFSFTYFNPSTRKYVTIASKTFKINVKKGDAQATVAAFNSGDQQDITQLGKDIRYIKTKSADLYKDGEGFYNSGLFYTLLLLGPILFGGAFFYRKWLDDQNSDQVKLKSKQANKVANKHLAIAQKQLTLGDKKSFYEAISRGLYGYLSDKLNIPVADLNKDNIISQLQARSLDAATINQLTDTMDLCEMARFAPVTGISDQQVFDKAKNTINEIEDKI